MLHFASIFVVTVKLEKNNKTRVLKLYQTFSFIYLLLFLFLKSLFSSVQIKSRWGEKLQIKL